MVVRPINDYAMKFIKKISLGIVSFAIAIGIWSFSSSATLDATAAPIQNGKYSVSDSLFNAYWYADQAEIRTYNLTQSRYGELHQGLATVIFVTETISKKKGIKPDKYRKTRDHVPVLKMNLLKKFGTGIYPYSMMLSTFTPLNEPQGMIKASASGQEWCGHIFSQMNQRKKQYDVVSYSYFEEEGDTQFTLPSIFTEDEIWSRIRLDYKSLPTGDLKIIPGLYYTRLEQHKFEAEQAKARLDIAKNEGTYTIDYPKRERTLAITFNLAFPHEIKKWEETYADKRAPNKRLTTTAVLNESRNIDYWNYNAEKHKTIRKELGVPY